MTARNGLPKTQSNSQRLGQSTREMDLSAQSDLRGVLTAQNSASSAAASNRVWIASSTCHSPPARAVSGKIPISTNRGTTLVLTGESYGNPSLANSYPNVGDSASHSAR